MSQPIGNATGAWQGSIIGDSPKDVKTYLASGAIAAKTIVVFADTGKVAQAGTSSSKPRQVGIALAAAADGYPVQVCTWGLVKDVNTQGTVNDNDLVALSGTTAGYASAVTPEEGDVIGVAIGAASGNLANIFVFKA